jgi:hypothetical protein
MDVVPQLREPLFVAVERFDYGEQLLLRRARITVEDLIDLCASYGPSCLLNTDHDLQIPHGRRISILVQTLEGVAKTLDGIRGWRPR